MFDPDYNQVIYYITVLSHFWALVVFFYDVTQRNKKRTLFDVGLETSQLRCSNWIKYCAQGAYSLIIQLILVFSYVFPCQACDWFVDLIMTLHDHWENNHLQALYLISSI